MQLPSADVTARTARRRRIGMVAIATLLTLDAFSTGLFGGGERTLAIVRTVVLPGLPFLEWHLPLGLVTIAAALAAVGAWLRWGTDWLPLLVVTVCLGLAAFVMPLHHAHDSPAHVVQASHEFTVVLIVFAFVAQLRLLIARLPGGDRLRRHLAEGLFFPAADTARAAAIDLLRDPASTAARLSLHDERLYKRAARISAWARFRFKTADLHGAHAPLRAALSLCDALGAGREAALRTESRLRLAGVPDSEPTWVRLLDGTLAALALDHLGESECVNRWRATFDVRFALRHGRRPAALHAPTMLSLGTARVWEHAAATALAHRAGWIDAADWPHLRPRCLGAAAGSRSDPDTLRLVAAGRLWANLTEDEEAATILARRTLGDEPVALALEGLSQSRAATTRISTRY